MKRILALGGVGLSVEALAAAAVLSVGTGSVERGSPVLDVVLGVITLAFPLVGALVVVRGSNAAIGSLFIVFGLVQEVGIAAKEYALQGLVVNRGSLPGPEWAGWLQENLLGPGFLLLLIFTVLLFPTGSLPSPRWRPAAAAYVVVGLGSTILWALVPGPLLEQAVRVDSPAGVPALAGPMRVLDPVLMVAFQVAPLLALASAVVRYRRSRGLERQQMKWLGASVLVVAVAVFSLPPLLLEGPFRDLLPVFLTLALVTMPVACGIAILRYRLWDIDRIVSRTLAYAAVTAVLVGLYAGVVVGIGSFAGGGSDLLVAGATLTVAGAFGPVRRRVQGAVDRRFNRARYDAERTIEAFGTRLRDEVDLEALEADLRAVVSATVAPAHATLWTPPEAPG